MTDWDLSQECEGGLTYEKSINVLHQGKRSSP